MLSALDKVGNGLSQGFPLHCRYGGKKTLDGITQSVAAKPSDSPAVSKDAFQQGYTLAGALVERLEVLQRGQSVIRLSGGQRSSL